MDDYIKLATRGSFGILKSFVLHIELVGKLAMDEMQPRYKMCIYNTLRSTVQQLQYMVSYSTWLAPHDKAICLKRGDYKLYSGQAGQLYETYTLLHKNKIYCKQKYFYPKSIYQSMCKLQPACKHTFTRSSHGHIAQKGLNLIKMLTCAIKSLKLLVLSITIVQLNQEWEINWFCLLTMISSLAIINIVQLVSMVLLQFFQPTSGI